MLALWMYLRPLRGSEGEGDGEDDARRGRRGRTGRPDGRRARRPDGPSDGPADVRTSGQISGISRRSPQELPQKVLDVVLAQRLRAPDDLVEVRVHQLVDHVDVGESLSLGRFGHVAHPDDVLVPQVAQQLDLAQGARGVDDVVKRVRDLFYGDLFSGRRVLGAADNAVSAFAWGRGGGLGGGCGEGGGRRRWRSGSAWGGVGHGKKGEIMEENRRVRGEGRRCAEIKRRRG